MTPCLHCQQSAGTEGQTAAEGCPLLEKLLPEGYAHLVCLYHETAQDQFRAHMKLRITSQEEAHKWLEDFQISSGVTWRKSRTYPNTGRYNSYRIDLRCQHNTFPKNATKKTKNTSCGATMFLVLKRHMQHQDRKSRSKDPHVNDGYLLNINLRHEHNHWVSRDDAAQKRDVSSEAIARLKILFESGHSPSTALHMIKYDLREQEGENYIYAAADRSLCPDLQFCYRLYRKLFQKSYQPPSAGEMLLELGNKIQHYNMLHGDLCAKMDKTEDGQIIIAICTPLMKRVHTMVKESGEIIFVDSIGNCERQNHCIFFLLTHSTAGPLPLGVLITTSKSQSIINSGFQMLKTLLPASRFFAQEHPQAFITDDCKVLRQSLLAVFPQTKLLLSMFHQILAMWRWLWSSHSGVTREDRPYLLKFFRDLVYADSVLSLTVKFNTCAADPLAMKYPRFLQQLAKMYGRHEEWAISLCNDLPSRSCNTNNFVESIVRVSKEMLLYRIRSYNTLQLVNFVTTQMEASYVRRLTNVALNRRARLDMAQLFLHGNADSEEIQQVDQSHYVVRNTTSEYDVNTEVGCCTCAVGVTGGLCKHQSAVLNRFGPPESVPHPITPQMRNLYYEVATGLSVTHESMEESPSFTISRSSDWVGILSEESNSVDIQNQTRHGSSGEDLEQMIQQFCRSLTDKLKADPQTFTAPIRTFLGNYKRLSDCTLTSALHCFGSMSLENAQHLQSSTNVALQPTVPAKRGRFLGKPRCDQVSEEGAATFRVWEKWSLFHTGLCRGNGMYRQ